MKIYSTTKLLKILRSKELMNKRFGSKRGTLIQRRITEFKAADTLEDIKHLPPQRLHKLTGNRANEFAVNVNENYRIVFYALDVNDEITVNKHKAVSVYIKEVVDYHEA
ncbi:hypothetical protein FD12_GL002450 [Lentilactobacillus rapi DSM 19907 = JCM 15042]|uniref:Plasmid maintenance system killer protein n=2 Tax=Lentilactobacillus rapi TaxID=481723 RepID=A0A512PNF3_9LACO|nr:type II toxin-antitoxin system RelE/ParE family toxin [Lentilactobacillus rapi]KRL16934.1 hypothetical protein FD12_GL002450 [Lentilactobacillus rapi DSM 19907 = JCM 15042]GEP72710.1 hypothetical protein LRA02_15780 [Lentilactobacillus rapi]